MTKAKRIFHRLISPLAAVLMLALLWQFLAPTALAMTDAVVGEGQITTAVDKNAFGQITGNTTSVSGSRIEPSTVVYADALPSVDLEYVVSASRVTSHVVSFLADRAWSHASPW